MEKNKKIIFTLILSVFLVILMMLPTFAFAGISFPMPGNPAGGGIDMPSGGSLIGDLQPVQTVGPVQPVKTVGPIQIIQPSSTPTATPEPTPKPAATPNPVEPSAPPEASMEPAESVEPEMIPTEMPEATEVLAEEMVEENESFFSGLTLILFLIIVLLVILVAVVLVVKMKKK